jgi:hypothetical protein
MEDPDAPTHHPRTPDDNARDLMRRVLAREERADVVIMQALAFVSLAGFAAAVVFALAWFRATNPGAGSWADYARYAAISTAVLFSVLSPVMWIRAIVIRRRAAALVARASQAVREVPIPPIIGERFGSLHVAECDGMELHLIRRTGTRAWMAGRIALVAVIAGVIVAIIATLANSGGRKSGALLFKVLFKIGAVVGLLYRLIATANVQWIVERDDDGARLSVEQVRWMLFRRVIDLREEDVESIRLTVDGTEAVVRVDYRDPDADRSREVRLAVLKGKELAVWRGRRLCAAIAELLDKNTVETLHDEEYEDDDEPRSAASKK